MGIMQMMMAGGGGKPLDVVNSLRVIDDDSAYLYWTPSGAGNRKTWTWSGWVKRNTLGTEQVIWTGGASTSSGEWSVLRFITTDQLQFINNTSNTTDISLVTTQVFRDTSSWMHIVLRADISNSTTNDRIDIFINGVKIDDYSTQTQPATTVDTGINGAQIHNICREAARSTYYCDLYLSDVHFVDGSALDASSFGMTTRGQWVPMDCSGNLTYGTNGFYLSFDNTSDLGADTSGNSNDFALKNFKDGFDGINDGTVWSNYITKSGGTVIDKPLAFDGISPGTFAAQTAHNYVIAFAPPGGISWTTNCGMTMAGPITTPPSYYGGFLFIGGMTSSHKVGGPALANCGRSVSSHVGSPGSTSMIGLGGGNGVGISQIYIDSVVLIDGYDSNINTAYVTDTPSNNYATLNPLVPTASALSEGNLTAAGSGNLPTIIPGSGQWYYEINGTGYNWDGTEANFTSIAGDYNFGQQPWNGTVTTGYKALNTVNLDAPLITDPSMHFDVATDTGANILSAATALTAGADFVWIKDRDNNSTNHILFNRINDSGMDGTPHVRANEAHSEATCGTYSAPSGNSVAWVWNAGSSTVSNTDGTITSSVRANTTAGFSIVSYNSGSSTGTVGHGLNAPIEFMLVKTTSASGDWSVYHKEMASTVDNYLVLNTNAANATASNIWGAAIPTSSVFGITPGTTCALNEDIITYCWSEVENYSKFGIYGGNSSNDGPFVELGFRPAVLLIKRYDSSGNWIIVDGKRNPFNVVDNQLLPNLGDGDFTEASIDLVSNGFKVRLGTSGHVNMYDFVYCAWAESPFKYSNAR